MIFLNDSISLQTISVLLIQDVFKWIYFTLSNVNVPALQSMIIMGGEDYNGVI